MEPPTHVIAGLVSAIPTDKALCLHHRDRRDKPGHDDSMQVERTLTISLGEEWFRLMPDLLFELFSEEIPARMQMRAAEDLKKLVTDRLVDAGLVYEGATAFVTPRRLALAVQGIPLRQPDLKEEKKGPRVGAPDQAVAGFLKSAGLASLAEATIDRKSVV